MWDAMWGLWWCGAKAVAFKPPPANSPMKKQGAVAASQPHTYPWIGCEQTSHTKNRPNYKHTYDKPETDLLRHSKETVVVAPLLHLDFNALGIPTIDGFL